MLLVKLKPFDVTLEHLEVGHQVVAVRDRLGVLQVGVAGHDRFDVGRRLFDQYLLQVLDRLDDVGQAVLNVEV